MTQYNSNIFDKAYDSPGLYDSPDSVMEAVQKYPHSRLPCTRLIDYSIVPTCAAWICVAIVYMAKAETVEQFTSQWFWISSLDCAHPQEVTTTDLWVIIDFQ